ncbi:MBL fold metallo-hydrolase [Sediminicoccus sp. KRV36]|uniref:MBL fold metallo-hydrolase n=1 Tax=Sediminicoccus sp. KRV36 TaxID=3133721 RepID=UPI00200D5AB7|nr:MBL fold metallo-hydrolase [Sediminicoccus rosea]UPY38710.1 MBL fold metallo-hydrolase [Sediminicoccus rosea]
MQLVAASRIEIQVIVDNVLDMLSSAPRFVLREAQQLRHQGMKRTSGGALCCASHGLSLLVTAHGPAGPRSLLFDGGPVDMAMERNATRLGVDFAAIEAVVLSHGHWDHAGGLPQALAMMRAANGGRATPLYLHPGMFRERGMRQPDGGVLPMDFIPAPGEWAAMGATPIVTAEPQLALDGLFYVSGEIPRVTPYERGLPGQVGRDAEDAAWQADELLMDERFLAVRLAGQGLIIFSACSHAGVVNVLHAARAAFPEEAIFAVMGGFHLSGENEKIIPETVRDIGGFDLPLVIPAHCTGWRAVNALERALGERVVPAAVGKLFTLE